MLKIIYSVAALRF